MPAARFSRRAACTAGWRPMPGEASPGAAGTRRAGIVRRGGFVSNAAPITVRAPRRQKAARVAPVGCAFSEARVVESLIRRSAPHPAA